MVDVVDRADQPGAGECRWCGPGPLDVGPDVGPDVGLDVVLDLGLQPTADHFPPHDSDERDDPRWPLQLGVCPRCGLAQLVADPGTSDEPRGLEPQALVDQAHEAVAAVLASGVVGPGRCIREFDSPHGGSWRSLLVDVGCLDHTDRHHTDRDQDDPVDVVVDVFGLMHEPDQRSALEERVRALAPDGTLLLQFHSLHSIVRQQQWNALRHGHMAYYSTAVLVAMLDELGLTARRAWTFDLYGGTVLLAATRTGSSYDLEGDATLDSLLATDESLALRQARGLVGLAAAAQAIATELTTWLTDHRDAGRRVIGYGAASRAVPLLVRAGIGVELLPAVADGSPAKWDRRLPASRVPIVPADELRTGRDDVVLLFVPDLLDEVRSAYPEVTARGAAWAVSEPGPHLV